MMVRATLCHTRRLYAADAAADDTLRRCRAAAYGATTARAAAKAMLRALPRAAAAYAAMLDYY